MIVLPLQMNSPSSLKATGFGEAIIALKKENPSSLQDRMSRLEQMAALHRKLHTYLPALRGTTAQLQWAFAIIRLRLLKQVIKRVNEAPRDKDLQALAQRINILFSQTQAKAWIHSRHHLLKVILEETV